MRTADESTARRDHEQRVTAGHQGLGTRRPREDGWRRAGVGCEASPSDDRPPVGPIRPSSTSWVFRTNATVGYVHMASVAVARGAGQEKTEGLVAAWQAARVAEGNDDQRLMVARSTDGGRTWSARGGGCART